MSELSTTRSNSRSGRSTSTKETNSTVSSRYGDNSPSSSPVTTRGDDMSRQEQTMDPSGQQSSISAASRPVTTTTTTTHTSSGSKKRSPECAKQSRENSKTPTKGSSPPPVSPAQTRIPTAFWFSETHPMIPRRYVPPWQLDMKNRELTIENCKKAGLDTWEGHISHFWEKRERMAVTNHRPYVHLMTGERSLKRIDSHLSKYNSSMLYFN